METKSLDDTTAATNENYKTVSVVWIKKQIGAF